MRFRFVPMGSETAETFRRTGLDDLGNRLRRMTAEQPVFPCRHCLRRAKQGEELLLGSFRLALPTGAYWTPSPVFVHADPCEFFASDEPPEILFGPILSIRAYDGDHQMIYRVSDVAARHEVLSRLQDAFTDEATRYVNVHTAQFGCYLCRAERADGSVAPRLESALT